MLSKKIRLYVYLCIRAHDEEEEEDHDGDAFTESITTTELLEG